MHERLLYDIAKGLHQEHNNLDRALQHLLSHTAKGLQAVYSCLVTFADQTHIEHIYLVGERITPKVEDRLLWQQLVDQGVIGHVYHSERPLVIRNIKADPRWTASQMPDDMPRVGSVIAIPLIVRNAVYGVMMFSHTALDYFGEEASALLDELCDLATSALTHILHTAQELDAYNDTRYQAIFEHTPVPVILTNSKGVILDANVKACEFLGFQRVVLRGIPLHDVNIVSNEEISAIGEGECYLPTNTYDIDGNSIPTLIRARRIVLDGEDCIEWILQDMSVQMELEQLRRDLTAMVYHDLRGPLSSIHMAILKLAELLRGHNNPAVLKILQLGLRSTQQVSRLVEALLDIQRLESGSTILNKQPSEVHVFLTDAFQLVQPIADQADITLELDIQKVPIVDVDSDMITRVVINLMENAIKYTPTGSHITIYSQQDDDFARITVSDTGPGIPENMLDSIFNKFSRVKYQDAPKGVGLGLAFCRLAVEAHGGRIWVESDGQNGSDFIFTLPIKTLEIETSTAQLHTRQTDDEAQQYASA
ncbi:MAG: ATP-binding protein [Anaerolineae bacterium]